MKAYLLTTGTVFALITLAHIWRAISESATLVRDPFYVILTLLSAGMSVWAWRLLRTSARS